MEKKIIELIDVYKYYGRQDKMFPALTNFSQSFQAGSFNVIVGESGSGKTTLLKLISGLIRPSKGEVLFEETNISSLNFSQLAAMRRRHFGFVFQDAGLLDHLTGMENIQFPELGPTNEEIADLAEYFGIAHCLNKFPGQMSLGERQRISIARAIFRKPNIVIADEPTANLDWKNSKKSIELLKQYSKNGMTILIATHDERIINFATQAFRLEKGVIIDI